MSTKIGESTLSFDTIDTITVEGIGYDIFIM